MKTWLMACSVAVKTMSSATLCRGPQGQNLKMAACAARTPGNARSYSVYPITKNLELMTAEGVGMKLESGQHVVLPGGPDAQRPLVVMLAWLLAKSKQLHKFTEIYLDQGFDVLTLTVQPWQMLWPTRGTQVLAGDILHFLDTNTCYRPLMLHGFSIGGYVWAEALVKMEMDKAKYQPLADRFVGQVWDSIADITEIPIGFPKAVFPNQPLLQAATEKYIRYHMAAFQNIATCHYIRASQVFHTTMVRAPSIMFVSKTDPIGSVESNTRVRESWAAQGMKTYMKCWDKSPHVMHYRYHPKEYLSELFAFMESIGVLAYPEKLRAKL